MRKLFGVVKAVATLVLHLHQLLLAVAVLGFSIWAFCHYGFGSALVHIFVACVCAVLISCLVFVVAMNRILFDNNEDPIVRLRAAQALTGRDYLAEFNIRAERGAQGRI